MPIALKRTAVIVAIVGIIGSAMSDRADAQTLSPATEWTASPVMAMWSFGTAITQSSGDMSGVRQLALPLRTGFKLGHGQRWSMDLNASFSSSSIETESAGSSRTLTLSGLSDLNARITGPLKDWLHLTAGVTVPTGKTELNGDETAVLQAIAAPALSMPVSALGLGLGGTVGLVGARQYGPWALALGLSLEQRSEYTPVALVLASGESRTTLKPGAAGHLSFGADRSVGAQRLSFLVIADQYAKDALTTGSGTSAAESEYTLGPQVTAIGRLEFDAAGWRNTLASATVRMRTQYSDASGAKVTGSNGTYVEGSIGGVRGRPTHPGIIFGADARFHSGLDFTNALIGAQVAAAGATIGVDWPYAAATLRVVLRAQAGSIKTGDKSSSAMGLQLSGSLTTRGGSR